MSRLDILDVPVRMPNGEVVQTWTMPRVATALKFNRVLHGGLSLYDVMEFKYVGAGSDFAPIGQIAVQTPDPVEIGNFDNPTFSMVSHWAVEPLGTAEGSNAFGGPIEVPIDSIYGTFRQN